MYIDCVNSVSRYWARTGMGDLMHMDIITIEAEAKYRIPFIYKTVAEVRWALDIYEQIVLENARKTKDQPK